MFGGKQKRKGNTKEMLSVCVIKCQIQVLRDVMGVGVKYETKNVC